jgi:hypothetical protein
VNEDENDFECEVFLDDGGAPPPPTVKDQPVIFPLAFMLGAQ